MTNACVHELTIEAPPDAGLPLACVGSKHQCRPGMRILAERSVAMAVCVAASFSPQNWSTCDPMDHLSQDSSSFIIERCFLEHLPLLPIVAKDDHGNVFACDQIQEFARAGA